MRVQSFPQKMTNAWGEEAEAIKEVVRRMLKVGCQDTSKKLRLIDDIQRLGIGYQFQEEIELELQQIHKAKTFDDSDDLYVVSLCFRLLRQHGYPISSDVFRKFKDENDHFKEDLIVETTAMLSLYEASYFSTHGDIILDEALGFTKTHLLSIVAQLQPPFSNEVSHALRWPLRRNLPILETIDYSFIYMHKEQHIQELSKLAELDFNIRQKLYQKELNILTKWWIELGLMKKLPFGRDRLVECYLWAIGAFHEPKFVFGRRMIVKMTNLISVFDDMYDAYGTIEELELFTKAVERWDMTMEDELPNYMKLCFQAMVTIFDEIDQETTKEGRPFCVHYVKEAMKMQIRTYITEARWMNTNYVPTIEEYMPVAGISVGYLLGISIILCGMGEIATEEVFKWLFVQPNKLINAISSLARLLDDIKSNEFEQNRVHVASAIQCYMNQHGVSQPEALHQLNKVMDNLWKDINEELLQPTKIPMLILASILNFICVMEVIYKDIDSYTTSNNIMKDIITSLFLFPINI